VITTASSLESRKGEGKLLSAGKAKSERTHFDSGKSKSYLILFRWGLPGWQIMGGSSAVGASGASHVLKFKRIAVIKGVSFPI